MLTVEIFICITFPMVECQFISSNNIFCKFINHTISIVEERHTFVGRLASIPVELCLSVSVTVSTDIICRKAMFLSQITTQGPCSTTIPPIVSRRWVDACVLAKLTNALPVSRFIGGNLFQRMATHIYTFHFCLGN